MLRDSKDLENNNLELQKERTIGHKINYIDTNKFIKYNIDI